MPIIPTHPEMNRPLPFAAATALVAAPYVYPGMLIAVAVHEFVGHGLVSLLVGGQFHGVMLDFSGMGWAAVTQPTTSPGRDAVVLLGGPGSTTFLGLALLCVAWLVRHRPYTSLPLTIVGGQCALEGTSYAFWNSVSFSILAEQGDGDIGRAIELFPDLRLPIMVLAGLLMALSIWSITALLLWLIESHIHAGMRLKGAALPAWAIAASLIPAGAWFLFDWDMLLPGMGHWPNAAAVALHFLAGASLMFKRPSPEPVEAARRSFLTSMAVGCGLLIVMVAVIGFWLRHGVMW